MLCLICAFQAQGGLCLKGFGTNYDSYYYWTQHKDSAEEEPHDAGAVGRTIIYETTDIIKL